MNKQKLFKEAHRLTREMLAEYPELKYRAQFAITLKYLYSTTTNNTTNATTTNANAEEKTITKKEDAKANDNNKAIKLDKEIVKIGDEEREVAIMVQNDMIYGFVDKERITWKYKEQMYPKFTSGAKSKTEVASTRLFILERLKMANITLPVTELKTSTPNTPLTVNTPTADTTNTKANTVRNIVLPKKVVTVNTFKRAVSLKVQDDIMAGTINNNVFRWEFTKSELPTVKVKEGSDAHKHAVYGRLYILERLKMDNIELPILSVNRKERKERYVSFETEKGVGFNVFENGYIRGHVNNNLFSWYPASYKDAVVLNVHGFEGEITSLISAQAIKDRIQAAGFDTAQDLINAVRQHFKTDAVTKTTDAVTKEPGVKFQATDLSNIDFSEVDYIYMFKDDEIVARYHIDGFIDGTIRGKEFCWDIEDEIMELPQEIRSYIKKHYCDVDTMNMVYRSMLSSNCTGLMNEILRTVLPYETLNFVLEYIDTEFSVSSVRYAIHDLIDDIEDIVKEGEDYPTLERDMAILKFLLDLVDEFEARQNEGLCAV